MAFQPYTITLKVFEMITGIYGHQRNCYRRHKFDLRDLLFIPIGFSIYQTVTKFGLNELYIIDLDRDRHNQGSSASYKN